MAAWTKIRTIAGVASGFLSFKFFPWISDTIPKSSPPSEALGAKQKLPAEAAKFVADHKGPPIFQPSRNLVQILGYRRVTLSEFHTEE